MVGWRNDFGVEIIIPLGSKPESLKSQWGKQRERITRRHNKPFISPGEKTGVDKGVGFPLAEEETWAAMLLRRLLEGSAGLWTWTLQRTK